VVGGSPYRHKWFGYPDGGVRDVSFDELVDRVAIVQGEERTDVVATFGPDGITGHPDHIRIGEAATAAFLRFAGDGGPGLQRLVYGGIRQSGDRPVESAAGRGGLTAWDPDRVYHPGACRTSGSISISTPLGWRC
jgi:LmbE family N-acetylglucosaminyl deacetylase